MPKKKKTARQEKMGLTEVKITIGNDLNGKRIQKSFYGSTKAEAKAKAEEYKLTLAKGEVIDKTITFGEWADKWLDTYKKGNVKSITFDGHYKNVVNTHLKPYFGGYKMASIKPIHIQGFYKTKAQVSRSLIKKCQSCLYAIFETAVDNDIIIKNPARNIKSPQGKPVAEKRVYTQAETDKVIEFAKSHVYGLGIILMLKTGIRRGELVALKWSDIDFERNVLHIQRAASDVYVSGKRVTQVDEGSALTKNHNRYIPFDDELKVVLLAASRKSEYIVPNTKGEINSPHNYSYRMYATFMNHLSKAHENIPVLNPHELRHTYGTLLKNRGVDVYTIQKLMGHSEIGTTGIYLHNDVDALKRALGIE